MKDQWIKDMRRLLDDYEKDPPDGLLDQVKQTMKERHLTPPQNKTQNTRILPLWFMRTAAAVAAIAVILLLFFLSPVFRGNRDAQTAQEAVPQKSRNEYSASSNARKVAMTGSASHKTNWFQTAVSGVLDHHPFRSRQGNISYTQSPSGLLSKLDRKIPDTSPFETMSAPISVGNSDSSGQNLRSSGIVYPESHQSVLDSQKGKIGTAIGSQKLLASSSLPKTKHRRRISIGPFGTGVMGSEGGSTGQGLLLAESAPYDPANSKVYPESNNLVYGIDKLHTKIHYNKPVKLGLSIGYPLTDHLSLHAGVTYSQLTSDETRSNSTEEYKTRQKLHYVGVQVSASQSLWRSRNERLNVYVTAGGGVDKMVDGKAKTKYYVNDKQMSVSNNDVKMHELQWSVNGTAGVEYHVLPHVGVYVEPGVSYYFKNGSQLNTYYRDKPFRPSLQFGIRLSLQK